MCYRKKENKYDFGMDNRKKTLRFWCKLNLIMAGALIFAAIVAFMTQVISIRYIGIIALLTSVVVIWLSWSRLE